MRENQQGHGDARSALVTELADVCRRGWQMDGQSDPELRKKGSVPAVRLEDCVWHRLGSALGALLARSAPLIVPEALPV